ncbi:MAG: hypothetical protein AB1671_22035 [Thermodesulfobacteriota bacterium]
MHHRVASLCVTFLFLSGCATATLQPAPWANIVPGPGAGAVAEQAGVRIEARAGAWRGIPTDLADVVTPLLVTLTNESAQPLRVRYQEFQLVSATGETFAALPPFAVEGTVTQRIRPPLSPFFGFGVAPYLSPYYPWAAPFDGPFAFDPLYYHRYYPTFVRVRIGLPTADMLEAALPEGVVEPQGRIAGFLYFERVGEEVARVDFRAELIDAQTEEDFGVITIPFLVV